MTKGHGWFAPRLFPPRTFFLICSFFFPFWLCFFFLLYLFLHRFSFLLASSLRFGFLGSLFHILADLLALYFFSSFFVVFPPFSVSQTLFLCYVDDCFLFSSVKRLSVAKWRRFIHLLNRLSWPERSKKEKKKHNKCLIYECLCAKHFFHSTLL